MITVVGVVLVVPGKRAEEWKAEWKRGMLVKLFAPSIAWISELETRVFE